MPKTVLIFLAMFSLLFVSCGKIQIEKAQDKIALIGNQFSDHKLTADEAIEQIDSILIPETEGNGDLYLKIDTKNH